MMDWTIAVEIEYPEMEIRNMDMKSPNDEGKENEGEIEACYRLLYESTKPGDLTIKPDTGLSDDDENLCVHKVHPNKNLEDSVMFSKNSDHTYSMSPNSVEAYASKVSSTKNPNSSFIDDSAETNAASLNSSCSKMMHSFSTSEALSELLKVLDDSNKNVLDASLQRSSCSDDLSSETRNYGQNNSVSQTEGGIFATNTGDVVDVVSLFCNFDDGDVQGRQSLHPVSAPSRNESEGKLNITQSTRGKNGCGLTEQTSSTTTQVTNPDSALSSLKMSPSMPYIYDSTVPDVKETFSAFCESENIPLKCPDFSDLAAIISEEEDNKLPFFERHNSVTPLNVNSIKLSSSALKNKNLALPSASDFATSPTVTSCHVNKGSVFHSKDTNIQSISPFFRNVPGYSPQANTFPLKRPSSSTSNSFDDALNSSVACLSKPENASTNSTPSGCGIRSTVSSWSMKKRSGIRPKNTKIQTPTSANSAECNFKVKPSSEKEIFLPSKNIFAAISSSTAAENKYSVTITSSSSEICSAESPRLPKNGSAKNGIFQSASISSLSKRESCSHKAKTPLKQNVSVGISKKIKTPTESAASNNTNGKENFNMNSNRSRNGPSINELCYPFIMGFKPISSNPALKTYLLKKFPELAEILIRREQWVPPLKKRENDSGKPRIVIRLKRTSEDCYKVVSSSLGVVSSLQDKKHKNLLQENKENIEKGLKYY